MSTAGIVLVIAALPIGLTGAWSPCGFSMVETIGLRGDPTRRRTALAACATFAPGAAVGGICTFGALALAGSAVHGAGGRASYVIAGCIAIAAALLEARGTRIVPQVRRQLPEGWRWSLPLPVASALYGVLLGLGFTTFVLSFGVWALAAISFALGDPLAGAAIGLSFGIGRAIPILALAPIADRPRGIRITAMMAERPALYRTARFGDALAMGAAAVFLIGSTGASAAHVVARPGADPSVSDGALVFQRADGSGAIVRGGKAKKLPGSQPAIGGRFLAVRRKGHIDIRNARTLRRHGSVAATRVGGVAISNRWLVFTKSHSGEDLVEAARLSHAGKPGPVKTVADTRHPSRAGHPSLDGAHLVYTVAGPGRDRIMLRSLGKGGARVVLNATRSWVTSPSILGSHIVFDQSIRRRQSAQLDTPPPLDQELVLSNLRGGHRSVLYRLPEGQGRLWSTAMGPNSAYVTVLQGGPDKIVRVNR